MKKLYTISCSFLLLFLCWNAAAFGSNFVIHSATLDASNPQSDGSFGDAVAIDGDTVVVGAVGALVGGRPAGAAYVFVKPSTGWTNMTQTAMLTASDSAYHFGASVAISGDTIVVGAPWTSINGVLQVGAVYVYVKPAGGWTNMTETAKLTGFHVDVQGEDWLGSTVSIAGDTIVAGVPNVILNGEALGDGEAFLYVKPPGGWTNTTETAVLFSTSTSALGFGTSVAISGSTVVVGATGCCIQGQLFEGSAYVFSEPSSGWATTSTYNAELTGTEVGANDFFGYAVAIDGDTVVVGSPQTYSYQVGAAYIYVKAPSGWKSMTQTAELYPLPAVQQNFGQSLAISGNVIIVGAPNLTVQHTQQGAAFRFVEPSGGWRTTSKYNSRLTSSSAYNVGQSVSISEGTIVVGGISHNGGLAIVYWMSQ